LGRVAPSTWSAPYPIENPPVRAFHQSRLIALLEPAEATLRPTLDLGRGC
jgi:hypothetical protein